MTTPTPAEQVDQYLARLLDIAQKAQYQANVITADLLSLPDSDFNVGNPSFDPVNSSGRLPSFSLPTLPVTPTFSSNTPELPTAPSLDTVNIPSVEDAPTFTSTAPDITLSSAPTVTYPDQPGDAPSIDTSLTFPTAPSDTLPTAPTLTDLDIPTEPSITYTSFSPTTALPTDEIGLPWSGFVWSESDYSSAMLTAAQTELLRQINGGGTIFSQEVEDAIWDRARDRESQLLKLEENRILVENPQSGWSRPTGSLLAALEGAYQEAQSKLSSINRDTAIKQSELEQDNLRFALQNTADLEKSLINFKSEFAARELDALKFTHEISVTIFNSKVRQQELEVSIYNAYVNSYVEQIRAELLKIEQFKSQIEAQLLINQANETDIQLYLAQIEAVKQASEIYRIQTAALQTRVDTERLRLDVYKTEVEAYAQELAGINSRFSAWTQQIQGEALPAEVYRTEAQAFAARVQGYATQVDAQYKRPELDLQVQEQQLREYLARLEAVVDLAQTEAAAYQNLVNVYRGEVDIYTAQVGAESARVASERENIDVLIRELELTQTTQLQNKERELRGLIARNEIKASGYGSAGNIQGSIASSAASALNVAAEVIGQDSTITNIEQ